MDAANTAGKTALMLLADIPEEAKDTMVSLLIEHDATPLESDAPSVDDDISFDESDTDMVNES